MSLVLLIVYVASLTLPQAPEAQPPAADARVAGRVRDAESNLPIAGASVTLVPTSPRPSSRGLIPRQAFTDDDGRFTFEALVPGRFSISAQKTGFALDSSDTRTINVAAGRSIVGIELALRKAGLITGRILDARGDPLSGIRVVASRRISGQGDRAVGMMAHASETNDLGDFRIAGLPAGEYVVIATPLPPPPFDQAPAAADTVLAPTFYPGTTDRDAAHVVTIGWGEIVGGLDFPIVSAPAFRISGVVVDEEGRPLADVMVLLMDLRAGGAPTPFMARTNQDGSFRIGGVVSGIYRLSAVMTSMQWSVAGGVAVGGAAAVSRGPSMPAPIEVQVSNADVTGLKIVQPVSR